LLVLHNESRSELKLPGNPGANKSRALYQEEEMKNTLRILSLTMCLLSIYLQAETQKERAYQPTKEHNVQSAEPIPAGTIIPVTLNSTLRSDHSESGDTITAAVMQDVVVASGETLHRGSRVTGHVIGAIAPGNRSDESKISFQFDEVLLGNQNVSITTNLRAIASKHAVLTATPQLTSSEYADNQVQIGGDQISYGSDGEVMVGSRVVGKYSNQGVLTYGGRDQIIPCRGTIDDNDHPQAFWLFSVNACGAYGLGDLAVSNAGHTTPAGEITLSSKSKVLKVDKGSAMLLLVGASAQQKTQARTTSSQASSRAGGQ